MNKLFLTILNMSLTASYVIIFIIFVRLLLKRSPKIISYALWSVVAFRLIVPFSFESMFSLMPRNTNAISISRDIIYQQVSQINSGIGVVDSFVSQSLTTPTIGASVNSLQIYAEIGSYIWVLGIIALLFYSFISILLLKKQLKSAQLIEENIFKAKNLKTPFVLGLIKPKIYLPVGINDEERNYILLHEQTHIHRKDHVIKVLAFIILSIHWFNPLVWAAFILMSIDMELSCDERVLKEMNEDIKKPYANSLLSLAAGGHILNGSPLAFSERNVTGRIKNVLNYKIPRLRVMILSIIITIIIGIGLMANPINANGRGAKTEIKSLVGYMVIKDNNLYFDEIEIVKSEDKERMKELDLDEEEMVSWYTIINEKKENNTYELADKVNYTFTDIYLNFIKESESGGNRIYNTTKKDEFLQHLAEYDLNDIPLSEQRIPYFIEVQDGKVISITEEFEYTI